MFIRQDLGLRSAIRNLQRWLRAPDAETPETARLAVTQLLRVAHLLDRWSEDETAKELRKAATSAQHMLDRVKSEQAWRDHSQMGRLIRAALSKPASEQEAAIADSLQFLLTNEAKMRKERFGAEHARLLSDLDSAAERVDRLCPLEGNIKPERGSRGMVVGLALERDLVLSGDHERALWQSIRGQFASLGAVRFTPYQPLAPKSERSDLRFVDELGRGRTVVHPTEGPHVRDERGQPIPTRMPQRRQAVAYLWIEGERAVAHQLTCVASALGTLTRTGTSGPSFSFHLLAASAELKGPRTSEDRISVTETGHIFDLFSQIIRDPLLANTIVTHDDLRCRYKEEQRHGHWFESVWRVPVQHRRRHPACDEWLYASPRFNGLPEFASPASVAPRQRAIGLERPRNGVGRRRLSSRLETGRPLPCQVGFQGAPEAKQDAYLIDYSPDGCKVLVVKEELSSRLSARVNRVWWPQGLPWPWANLRYPDEMHVEEAKRRERPAPTHELASSSSGVVEISLRSRSSLRDRVG